MKKNILVIVGLLFFNVFQLLGQGEKFETSLGYSFSIASGWRIIPQEVSDARRAEIKKTFNVDIPNFDVALQLASAKDWYERPYIIITRKDIGKLSDGDIRETMKSFDSLFVKIKEDMILSSKGLLIMEKISKKSFDEKNKILYLIFPGHAEGFGSIINYQVWMLTNKGYIQFVASSLAADFETFFPDFDFFIQHFEIKEDLKYQDSHDVENAIDWYKLSIRISSILIVIMLVYFGKKGLRWYTNRK